MHRGVQMLVRDLNRLYRELPALHQRDCESEGFEWLELHDNQQSVLVFMRRAAEAAPEVVVACNFTPVPRLGYRVGVPRGGYYRERLNTDAALYGGANIGNGGGVMAEGVASHGRPHSLSLTLPPLATVILEHQRN
jgi:1,4-alpha-glucan branching enzyme